MKGKFGKISKSLKIVGSSSSIHTSDSIATLPRAHITTGTISTILSFHNPPIFLFKSWYFSTFSLSFSPTLASADTTISIILPFWSFLSITNMPGLFLCLCHVVTLNLALTSSFSTAPSGTCSYQFYVCSKSFFLPKILYREPYIKSLFLQRSQWTFFAILSLLLSGATSHIHLLIVAHFHLSSHIIYAGGFHYSYRFVFYIVCPDRLFLCST